MGVWRNAARPRGWLESKARAGCRLLPVLVCSLLLAACATRVPPVSEVVPAAPVELRTVALLGATGMVGGYLLQEALARGHAVRALARNAAKLPVHDARITVIQGDARDPAVVEELVRGSDIVISALGPVRADGDAAMFVSTDATRNVLRAMASAGVSRYIVVSGGAVVMPGDERDLLGWWIRALVRIGLADTLRDKQAEYELLAASSVAWTLVRCPLIDPVPFRYAPLSSLSTPPAFRLRAGELARFVIGQVDSEEYLRAGPFLGSRQVQ